MNGLPPHIAQVIAGHKDINTTMGYKAVYPEEAIHAHLAFLARRRAQRPTEEYRVPSEEEWQEFLGHFERRKVATGICGRAFGTPCIHEHSCLRCSMHWPEPAQRPRIAEIRDNLLARRRALRPTEEYRVPTDAEWQEFLGHFERRKVATGICGRAFRTPCIHEHSCLRCSMHWPSPAQRPRIAEIHDNLIARIAEAEAEGWLGEVEGLKVSLAGADDKLA